MHFIILVNSHMRIVLCIFHFHFFLRIATHISPLKYIPCIVIKLNPIYQPNISNNKLIELTRLKKYIILIFFRIQTISIFKNYIEY
jgi:hypothetical protein